MTNFKGRGFILNEKHPGGADLLSCNNPIVKYPTIQQIKFL